MSFGIMARFLLWLLGLWACSWGCLVRASGPLTGGEVLLSLMGCVLASLGALRMAFAWGVLGAVGSGFMNFLRLGPRRFFQKLTDRGPADVLLISAFSLWLSLLVSSGLVSLPLLIMHYGLDGLSNLAGTWLNLLFTVALYGSLFFWVPVRAMIILVVDEFSQTGEGSVGDLVRGSEEHYKKIQERLRRP